MSDLLSESAPSRCYLGAHQLIMRASEPLRGNDRTNRRPGLQRLSQWSAASNEEWTDGYLGARKPACETCGVNDACPSAFKAENVGRKPKRVRPGAVAKKAAKKKRA